MKVIKRAGIVFLLMILTGAGCIFYAFKIEPYRTAVKEYALTEQHEGTEDIKIVQISDLHIKEDYTYKNLNKVIKKINSLDSDIVIFTGDLYDNYAKYHDNERIIEELSNVEARYAKIAIWGNRDYGGGAVRSYGDIMKAAGFWLLKNESRSIVPENGKSIWIAGLDDSLLGNPGLPEEEASEGAYKILLTHEPDRAEDFLHAGFDVILSGHSHGGQIDIPFLPAVNKAALEVSALSTEYGGGMHMPVGEKGVKVYVNSGIGTSHISARFGVVPEIALFHVYR